MGELRHQTGRGDYPAINVDGHVVSGFAPAKWEHLLQAPRRQGKELS